VDLLIDTSVLVAIERRGVRPEVLFGSFADRRAAIAAITVSELLHGVHRADTAVRRGQRERFVEETLAVFPVLAFDLETARVHGRLWADLSRIGQTIGAHDLLIAATAVHHGLGLVTVNEREFRRVSGVEIHDWR
jgi:tRNA(fMet)-specific endonuclease VapC